MKKVLLIIALTLCIFQMVVLATAIDIGSEAIDRGNALPSSYVTAIDKNNSANETGTITSIEIWADSNLSNCEVATFFVVSGNNLSTRDTHTIGSVTAGSKQTFSGLSLDVQTGDYLGIYYSSGAVEFTVGSGGGLWHTDGSNLDYIPCTNQAFTFQSSRVISLYGTGATAAAEEDDAIFFGFNF